MFELLAVFLVFLIYQSVMFALFFAAGSAYCEEQYKERIENLLNRYKPHSPMPEIRGFKYQIREEFELEHTADELRRPYFPRY